LVLPRGRLPGRGAPGLRGLGRRCRRSETRALGPHLLELLGLPRLVEAHGRPAAGQLTRRDLVGPPAAVEPGRFGREPAGLGPHDDALDQHLAGQLLGELGPQPAHLAAEFGQLAEVVPQRCQRGHVVAQGRDAGDVLAQRGQRREVAAQLGDPGDLVAQTGQARDVAAQRVELVAHRVLGLAAHLVLEPQLVLPARGHLALELQLVRAAQLGLPGSGGGAVAPAPAGGEHREDERPRDGHDGDPQVLRVVGEEDREGGQSGEDEATGEQEGPSRHGDDPLGDVVVLAAGHGP
jgi:hypothetical protein